MSENNQRNNENISTNDINTDTKKAPYLDAFFGDCIYGKCLLPLAALFDNDRINAVIL